MPHVSNPPLITEPRQLDALIQEASKQDSVGVDTESNSLHAFHERVCLIQFSTPSADYLIDPIAFDNLSALERIFANGNIQKVFHAAEYDLLTLKRDYGFHFANLFDTMLAARTLGYEQTGLGNLLKAKFNVALEKKHQRADWGKRPLGAELLNYARLDTHYLIQLRDVLHGELVAQGRLDIAQEDFERAARVNGIPPGPAQVNIWRMDGAQRLTPRQAAILQSLAEYRQKVAQELDRPPFKVMSDSVLVSVSAAEPKNINELEALKTLTPKQIERFGSGLLDAARKGSKAAPLRRPRRPRADDAYLERLDKLKQWRKRAGAGLKVESDVILPREVMEDIARANPANDQELGKLMASVPWRLKEYGEEIRGVLAKTKATTNEHG